MHHKINARKTCLLCCFIKNIITCSPVHKQMNIIDLTLYEESFAKVILYGLAQLFKSKIFYCFSKKSLCNIFSCVFEYIFKCSLFLLWKQPLLQSSGPHNDPSEIILIWGSRNYSYAA